MTSVEKLCSILQEKGLKPKPETFMRVRAGYWQRFLGAWSWEMYTECGQSLGSQWPVKTLLKLGFIFEKTALMSITLYPKEEN